MNWFLDDGDIKLAHGDVIQTLRGLPAGIAQTCVTSPPYWGLRSYLPDGHDDKATELGLEASPDLYVERIVAVFREVWRVLRDDGTVWLNLGDSYTSGNSGQRVRDTNGGFRPGLDTMTQGATMANPGRAPLTGAKPKDLVGVPWRVAFALQADGWYLRSDIVWSKPNPMPESVTDRPTKAHEYLFLLAKRPRYFYDQDAIREPHDTGDRVMVNRQRGPVSADFSRTFGRQGQEDERTFANNPAGRNRRSVWTIPTEPFPEAHFATYPQALVRPCIQAGTSEHGECSSCGAPWVRETESTPMSESCTLANGPKRQAREEMGLQSRKTSGLSPSRVSGMPVGPDVRTTGWRASCTCDAPTRPQTVLDPFIGSGTTALVARNHGRRCIGIDLSAEYLAIAAKRLQQLSLLGELA